MRSVLISTRSLHASSRIRLTNIVHLAQSTMNVEASQHEDADTIGTANINLYDITPMDYFSKTQTPLSKSSVFRAELWRRRHRQTNGSGGAMSSACGDYDGARNGVYSQTPKDAAPEVDIETVLTRNMSQDDLKRLIEHQMVEALKLVQMYTMRADDGSSGVDSLEDIVDESGLNETCAALDVSVRRTPKYSTKKQRRSKSRKIVKEQGHCRRITM